MEVGRITTGNKKELHNDEFKVCLLKRISKVMQSPRFSLSRERRLPPQPIVATSGVEPVQYETYSVCMCIVKSVQPATFLRKAVRISFSQQTLHLIKSHL